MGKEKRFPTGLLTVFLLALTFICYTAYKSGVGIDDILGLSGSSALFAFVLLMFLYAIKSVVMFIPIMALYLAGGAIFSNMFLGMAVNILGIAVSISVGYFTGRSLGWQKVEKLYERYPKIKEISDFETDNSFFFSFIIRVVGIVPCDLVSIYCGFSRIPYLQFMGGSIFGMLPGVILTSIMGASIRDPLSPAFIISTLCQIFTTCVSLLVYRKMKKNSRR
ncbi:MAG: VTT domain-containing protein [Oscillospiraceae bacterium]